MRGSDTLLPDDFTVLRFEACHDAGVIHGEQVRLYVHKRRHAGNIASLFPGNVRLGNIALAAGAHRANRRLLETRSCENQSIADDDRWHHSFALASRPPESFTGIGIEALDDISGAADQLVLSVLSQDVRRDMADARQPALALPAQLA